MLGRDAVRIGRDIGVERAGVVQRELRIAPERLGRAATPSTSSTA